ncbi:Hypothetical_protein [Hexamita inflata]|uniref:Hypothetical_protein n=1 Tax=Hexamita inflata TaxID=28002 RepID=A0ABP1HMN4_9EUKA
MVIATVIIALQTVTSITELSIFNNEHQCVILLGFWPPAFYSSFVMWKNFIFYQQQQRSTSSKNIVRIPKFALLLKSTFVKNPHSRILGQQLNHFNNISYRILYNDDILELRWSDDQFIDSIDISQLKESYQQITVDGVNKNNINNINEILVKTDFMVIKNCAIDLFLLKSDYYQIVLEECDCIEDFASQFCVNTRGGFSYAFAYPKNIAYEKFAQVVRSRTKMKSRTKYLIQLTYILE